MLLSIALRRRLATAALLAIFLAAALPATAQVLEPEGLRWRVAPDFGKGPKARHEISGAACAPTSPPWRSCLAVNDEKKYAQFFAIEGGTAEGGTIVPGAFVRLSAEGKNGDPDAEGVAYDSGYFYVTGSHGRSRNTDKPNASSYRVFRIKADPRTGRPPVVSDDEVVGIERSERLKRLIAVAEPVGRFEDRPLAKGGLNVEGIAVKNGRMFVGFRGPSIDRQAFIMSLDAAALFTGAGTRARMHALPLGKNVGIRDLAAVDDGLLVLSGPMREEKKPFAVWLWNEREGARLLGVIPRHHIPKSAKAETLLVLATEPRAYRVLVMFDGVENGGPMSLRLPR
ncbi:DUF3616 domain-containing protein [Xanthobacteraceae bacterium Astr-EGSB]|uniref:DUF3616 domain-containing protein n=1 Tax=Astrobacterium formosum TaxID=3069710 RepID=UPI0027B345DA|nr:DUF3616 domain-containing protein [Xanthobacteraceae bacterium Astr-EGSB]